WSVITTSSKRLHDVGKSGLWLAAALVPVIGPLYLLWQLLFRRGKRVANEFGRPLQAPVDYQENDDGLPAPETNGTKWIINDVTRLNPIVVGKIERPKTVEDLCTLIRETKGPISIGGGRFSMGGQTASYDSVHLDLRRLDRVLEFSKVE